jgi:uncharacterized membrane protein YeaQ/YmgE (transglycosylase-associated protein family)
MFLIEWLVEGLFFEVCGWVGHMVVKAITFGKVDLEFGDSSESILTAVIGAFFLLAVAIAITAIW